MAEEYSRGQAGRVRQPGEKRVQKRTKSSTNWRIKKCDYSLGFMILFLVGFGLVMMYSASLYTETFFKKQALYAVAGVGVMYVVSLFRYQHYRKLAPYLIVVAFLLVLAVFTPLGVSRNGSTRWIGVGPITFQPAEVFKIAVIIFNAALLTSLGRKVQQAKCTILLIVGAAMEAIIILVFTDNLSSGLIVGFIAMIMIFVARPNMKVMWSVIAVVVIVVAAFLIYVEMKLASGTTTEDFRLLRIFKWLKPEQYNLKGENYQTMQSLYAVGSGGFWGKGIGSSTQKMILPEAMNDTVFAIICEETGFVGASFVMLLYIILLQRLIYVIRNAKDLYGSLLVVGIFGHIAIQAVLNIAVVTNSIPSTGVTLPFISYGGTALMFLLAEMGIALSVSRQITLR